MSLLAKTILYFLGISIIVFGVGGVVAYDLISKEIAMETDYYLAHSIETIERRIKRAVERGYDINRYNTEQLYIRELPKGPARDAQFGDTLAMHPHLNQMETMRKMQVVKEIEGKFFEITMIDVVVEDSDIYESVVSVIIRLFALLALAWIIGAFILYRTVLRPFNTTLERIKKFKVQDPNPINLPKTGTKEFSQLNTFIKQMTGRAQSEYQSLKKFSEDASHEIQTPLAIASGKLDLLLDNDEQTEEQFALIAGAQQALSKLSQVSKSLSLLTKIGNKEFDVEQKTNLSSMVNEAVDNFKELFEMRNLDVHKDVKENVVVNLDSHLGNILLNNLIHNAIKHNKEGGYVDIKLGPKSLKIKNSGTPLTVPPEKLFNRFEKNSENGDSSGLGLSIVKEICDFHSMKIDYTYFNDHQLEILF